MSQIDWGELLGWEQDQLEDLCFIGYSYLQQGHYDIAQRFFDALSILEPDNVYHTQTLGALHLQQGEYNKALNYLETSLREEPDHIPTLLNRTKALFALGYKRQALASAQRLVNHPDEKTANQVRALILSYA